MTKEVKRKKVKKVKGRFDKYRAKAKEWSWFSEGHRIFMKQMEDVSVTIND